MSAVLDDLRCTGPRPDPRHAGPGADASLRHPGFRRETTKADGADRLASPYSLCANSARTRWTGGGTGAAACNRTGDVLYFACVLGRRKAVRRGSPWSGRRRPGKTAVGVALARTARRRDRVRRLHAGLSPHGHRHRQADAGGARACPFHAVDVADPDEEWTLADYQRLGEAACETLERGPARR